MLDHASVAVRDLAIAGNFYDAALAPLGLMRVWTADDAVGYGPPGGNDCFAVKRDNAGCPTSARVHLAFASSSAEDVTRFYSIALERGGTDDGGCGQCPEYGEGYFAAFVRDPDGNRLEAVYHHQARG